MKNDKEDKDQLDLLLEAGPSNDEAERNAAEEAALAAAKPLDEEPAADEQEEESSMRKIVDAFTSDDDEDDDVHITWTLPSILGGEILNAKWFRKHAILIGMIFIFFIVYVTNRYGSQQELIEIDKLKIELADKRCDATTRSSQLMQKCRPSSIEESLKALGDTTLGTNTEPPFIIQNSQQ